METGVEIWIPVTVVPVVGRGRPLNGEVAGSGPLVLHELGGVGGGRVRIPHPCGWHSTWKAPGLLRKDVRGVSQGPLSHYNSPACLAGAC